MSEPTPWVFPLGAPTDDPRLLFPVFSVLPNWKEGVTERLEWLTEVFTSETSEEQRRALRRQPRRTFEAGFLRTNNNRTRLDMFMAGTGKKKCLMPLWHEQFTLRTPLGGDGLVEFPADTLAKREWAVGDLAMITTGEPDRYAVLWVSGVNTEINFVQLLAPANVGAWPQGSRIIPLRVARIMDDVSLDNHTDRAASTQIRFTLIDSDPRFSPSWGHCSPLWRLLPDRSSKLKLDYSRDDFVLDFSAGVIDVTDPGNQATVVSSMDLTLFGRDAVWAYRQFLYAARGRLHRFYVPTFTADIFPTENLAGLTFDAQMNGFSEYMKEPQQARLIIGVEFKDDRKPLYRTITDIAPINETFAPFRQVGERFSVDRAFPLIQLRHIERISFIVPSRFDQDSFEIQHHTDNCAAVTAAVVTRSVTSAGMASVECSGTICTSRPYPLDPSDSMEGSANYLGGQIFKFVIDEAVPSADFLGGTLTYEYHGLIEIDTGPDDMTGSADFLDGTLTYEYHGLIEIDTGPDDMTGGADFLDGTLVPLEMILYENYLPEDVSVGADFLDGTLTLGV